MEIIWTETAKIDLHKIFKFLQKSNVPTDKCKKIISNIVTKVRILKKMPLSGQREPRFSDLPKEYRRLIHSHYKIIYHISSDTLFINRVFDSRQNPNKLFIK